MAQEKAVDVTVDRDLDHVPEASCFDKTEIIADRNLAIPSRQDRVNAGEVSAVLQSEGLGIDDVTTPAAAQADPSMKLTRDDNANGYPSTPRARHLRPPHQHQHT